VIWPEGEAVAATLLSVVATVGDVHGAGLESAAGVVVDKLYVKWT